jgi:AcrR family transcriptional regulator
MIAGAAALLARRGMGATSFSEVLAATGAPRGSLYHHFPGGKDELMAAATRYVGDRLLGALDLADPATPAGVIGQFTALWRSVLSGSDLEAGCAVAAVAVDAGPEQEQLVELAGSVFAEWRGALARRLERVGMSQERSRDLALLSLAAMEGALVVCRAQRSIEDFDRVSAMLVSLGGSSGIEGTPAGGHG